MNFVNFFIVPNGVSRASYKVGFGESFFDNFFLFLQIKTFVTAHLNSLMFLWRKYMYLKIINIIPSYLKYG